MNEHETQSDAELAALDAWEKEQRTKKRRAALGVAAALVVGFIGAAIAGRTVVGQNGAQHAASVAAH